MPRDVSKLVNHREKWKVDWAAALALDTLRPREREYCELRLRGLTVTEARTAMDISRRTLNIYQRAVWEKLRAAAPVDSNVQPDV